MAEPAAPPVTRRALLLAARLGRTLLRGARRLRRTWRRSMLVRTVTVTMVLGLAVLSVVGSFLYQRVADGLVEERRNGATAEVIQLARRVEATFATTDQTTSDGLLTVAQTAIQSIAGTEQSRFTILARDARNTNRDIILQPVVSGDVGLSSVPADLRDRVARTPGIQQTQIISVELPGDSRATPAWVIAQQVDTGPTGLGPYDLYVIYPMAREQNTLDLVGRTFVVGGIVLMFLIGGVAYVVTRLVVAPVRRAAAVAERLASGELDERMRARGEDDIAILAQSFNEMAANIQQQIDQLESLSRFQQRFVSDVSHELRTPLTTIRMAGDLIHDSRADFDPAVARSSELLHAELDRFEALLTDLLEISRFDAGAAVLDLDPTDLRAVVARVVDSSASLAERRGSPVEVDQPDDPCLAEVDARRIERVLRNLVVNALEHGESRPVEIRIAQDEHAVAVAVRDHGIGLRPGEAAMVFNRFWRADPARARTTGGTGLGLAISLEDARLHAGWLQAWGAPGEGSCFRLTLPRRAGAVLTGSPLPLNPQVPPRAPRRRTPEADGSGDGTEQPTVRLRAVSRGRP
ncbi:MtrAB system histidine kinase MtrB [Lapillicoccus jejuensis]|uniref:Sensor histidine kinase MtrB n=1 Tax=Lapillicoccus jejuensis TaxID=402171 RepID=A0A542E2H9_9MICO|nr:MtrAB system histidine kinase MtrB [Lapillicoccus jejuensis]TQJ09542.1 two-component system sensor histidine kinase MtrB [Lapillicoccus jejuensis]